MKHLISDHTPMDDYQWIIKQAYYTIESDEEYSYKPDNNKDILKNTKKYRYIIRIIKILLVLTGIMVISTIVILLRMDKTGNSIVLRNLGFVSILLAVGAFGLAIFCAVAGAWMESHYAGNDISIRDERRRRSMLLKNGNIAVVYKSFARFFQMTNRFYDWNKGQEVDVPFSKMYLISRVYSIKRKNSRIIASVKCLEYMMVHPFVNEYTYDGVDVEHYVCYYTRNKHIKFEWSDKMVNAERLLSALQALEK